jgi:hypothetical protein
MRRSVAADGQGIPLRLVGAPAKDHDSPGARGLNGLARRQTRAHELIVMISLSFVDGSADGIGTARHPEDDAPVSSHRRTRRCARSGDTVLGTHTTSKRQLRLGATKS